MNVFRWTNFYYLRKNICPDYVLCTSFYKFDSNVFSKLRASSQPARELYTSNNKIEYYASPQYTVGNQEQKLGKVRMLHFTPKQDVSVEDITTQVMTFIKTIQMKDLKDAPTPAFWYSVASLVPFIMPPLCFMIFGYSRFLASAELYYAATFCAFFGGARWGYTLSGEEPHTWENYGWSMVPQMFGWLTLLLPQSLGYLVVITGMAVSTYLDLTMVKFPCWYRAVRFAVFLPAMIGLLLTLLISIFG